MPSLLSKKVWRVQDVLRTDGTEQLVSILKVSHPFRRQRITIIPAPRYAKEQYFEDWIYQPYVKEHTMYVSNDIYNPFYVFYCRMLLKRDRFPGYAYFHPMGFPDCIEVNLTRREFIQREQPLRTPASTMLLTSTRFRDKHHPWVARRVLKIVGEQYVVHPRENMQSMVFILPPSYVPDAVNVLQSLGFQVTDSATTPIGDEKTLRRLDKWSNMAQWFVLGYLWIMIIMFAVGESRHIKQLFREYQRELVLKAGKDPEKMGLSP